MLVQSVGGHDDESFAPGKCGQTSLLPDPLCVLSASMQQYDDRKRSRTFRYFDEVRAHDSVKAELNGARQREIALSGKTVIDSLRHGLSARANSFRIVWACPGKLKIIAATAHATAIVLSAVMISFLYGYRHCVPLSRRAHDQA